MNLANMLFYVFICLLHISICLVLVFKEKMSKPERAVYLPLVLALPVFGALIMHISLRKGGGEREAPVAAYYGRLKGDVSPLASAAERVMPSVAPFEEIMLISDEHARREAMMYILRRDPAKYLEMLKTARLNADTEIAHYATAAIMEVQRDFELSVQQGQEAFKSSPDDIEKIDGYIGVMTDYINSGLLQGNTRDNLRRRLSEALELKLSVSGDSPGSYRLLAENEISLRRYSRASKIAESMRQKWPADETSWITSLHVCMSAGDSVEKAKITARLRDAGVNWSRKGREDIEFLCGVRIERQGETYKERDVQYVAK